MIIKEQKSSSYPPADGKNLKPPDRVLLCVPRWDETAALSAGAKYDLHEGFYAHSDDFLDPLWAWLPRRWRAPPALLPEMLPADTWEQNLRTALPADRWDTLRRAVYSNAGYRCEICGQKGEPHLEAHEAWSFDDTWCVQTLTGLLSLCPTCHKCHHLGLARRLGLYERCLQKMEQVNDWTPAQVRQSIAAAADQAQERSRYAWHVDLSWLESGRYYLDYRLSGSR